MGCAHVALHAEAAVDAALTKGLGWAAVRVHRGGRHRSNHTALHTVL